MVWEVPLHASDQPNSSDKSGWRNGHQKIQAVSAEGGGDKTILPSDSLACDKDAHAHSKVQSSGVLGAEA